MRDRLVLIYRPDLTANRCGEVQRVAGYSDGEILRFVILLLRVGAVQFRAAGNIDAHLLYVADDPDDGHPTRRIDTEADVLADRIFVGKKPADERLIHNNDLGRVRAVSRCKI